MLDFVSIFTKGGILLWCYQGAGLLEEELRVFRSRVNAFVNDVLLQEMTAKGSAYESGSLALKYKLDNEFELVFVAAYQKVLPLLYLDKLLDEIQLRFRDRYQKDLKVIFFNGCRCASLTKLSFRRTIFFAPSPPSPLSSTGP